MTWSRKAALVVVAIAVLTLSACAAGPNNVAYINAPHIAGFWMGLWQGIICPFTFIISLFNHNVNIYEVHNNGDWYNFGFVLGAGILFGGGSSTSSRKS
jgi:polyferredoxin